MGKVLVFMEFKHGFLLTFFDLKKNSYSQKILYLLCVTVSVKYTNFCVFVFVKLVTKSLALNKTISLVFVSKSHYSGQTRGRKRMHYH